MGKTDPEAASHQQQSMILLPLDTPGITILRDLTVFGYNDREGHCEVILDNVRVPAGNLLGAVGGGFAMSRGAAGTGTDPPLHASIGAAEQALELMCLRARSRAAFWPMAPTRCTAPWWRSWNCASTQAADERRPFLNRPHPAASAPSQHSDR
jgi:acyl-CoA dehydrogenase